MDDVVYLMLLMTLVVSCDSLECYNCSNITDIDECKVKRFCSNSESCYHSFSLGKHSTGCVDNKKCDSRAAASSIVGRNLVSMTTSSCFECCSTNDCNSALCRHPGAKVCMDDASVDCAKMNSLFSICSDITHARSVCSRFCGLCTVDGEWSLWSSWSQCDVTCENGHQTKYRTCTNPAPQNGGLNCSGDKVMIKFCKTDTPCPVDGGWSDWSHWEQCSVTCGMGLQRRSRTCSNPPPSLAGNHCFGDNTETNLCMQAPCANGGWSDWTSWSACTVTCGGGIRSQSRSCSNPHPSPYGKYCVGPHDKMEPCANHNCETKHCASSPCIRGQCLDTSNDFVCVCYPGNTGRFCNISTGAYLCTMAPCNHGTCVPGIDDYTCICEQGFTGPNCDNITKDVYSCKMNPCVEGTCEPGINDYTCTCNQGYTGKNCDKLHATDCYDILHNNIASKIGVYNVSLWKSKQVIEVYCDMSTDTGGWTVLQYRFDGSVNFARTFKEYVAGFGSYAGEYWLGLEYITELASQGVTELRIDLTGADNSHVYEVFPYFSLGNHPGYELHINEGTGTAGDEKGLSYHNGSPFLTYDHDNMARCAQRYHGGWWYRQCANSNLNGEYFTPGSDHGIRGMFYEDFKLYESLKSSRMMFRRT